MTEEIKEQETEVVRTERDEMIPFGQGVIMPSFQTDQQVLQFTQSVIRNRNAMDMLVEDAVRRLDPKDIVNINGKPYFQGSGCQKLIKYFAISVKNKVRIPATGYETIILPDTNETVWRITFQADFMLGVISHCALGIRDTRNKLLGKNQDGYKNISQIELPDLDRGAQTSMYHDGVCTLLGLKGMTWEWLKSVNPLFTPENCASSVTYKTGSRGGDMSGSQEGKNLKTEVWRMLLEMYNKDEAHCREKLEFYSRYDWKGKTVAGKTDVSQMSDKQAQVVYSKVKKDYEEYLKSVGGEQKPIDDIPF